MILYLGGVFLNSLKGIFIIPLPFISPSGVLISLFVEVKLRNHISGSNFLSCVTDRFMFICRRKNGISGTEL